MQQVYKRKPMLKCKITLWHERSPVNLLHILSEHPFLKIFVAGRRKFQLNFSKVFYVQVP